MEQNKNIAEADAVLHRLQSRLGRLDRDNAVASNDFEQAMATLKEQYGIETLEDAQAEYDHIKGDVVPKLEQAIKVLINQANTALGD